MFMYTPFQRYLGDVEYDKMPPDRQVLGAVGLLTDLPREMKN